MPKTDRADKTGREPLPRRGPGVLSFDALGGLSLAALITFVFLVGLLLAASAGHEALSKVMPAILGGLVVSTLILFRHWQRNRQNILASHSRLTHMANHDQVTGLVNRNGFLKAFASMCSSSEGGQGQGAVVCLGLGRLNDIAANLGDLAAEQIARETARRLLAAFSDSALIGRVSDDVFAIAYRASGADKLSLLGGRITQLIDMPIETVGGRLTAGAVLGVTFVPLNTDGGEALRQARLAMAAARAGGSSAALFEPQMDAARSVQMAMETELREALHSGALNMVYQPQVNEQGTIIGVEALMRWNSPSRGQVPPAIFVPLADTCGLGEQLGRFAMDQAMSDSRRWSGVKVAINVSPVQLRGQAFVEQVEKLLKTHGVSAADLELEITEGILLEANATVISNLERLRKLGFHLALDDFGTGYSGLSYLSQFRVDKIKIDRSFVTPLGLRTDAAPIIRAIAELSEAVGVKVIAEGVETRQQLDALRREGCKQAQGFFVGRPVPAEEIDIMLTQAAEATRKGSSQKADAASGRRAA